MPEGWRLHKSGNFKIQIPLPRGNPSPDRAVFLFEKTGQAGNQMGWVYAWHKPFVYPAFFTGAYYHYY